MDSIMDFVGREIWREGERRGVRKRGGKGGKGGKEKRKREREKGEGDKP